MSDLRRERVALSGSDTVYQAMVIMAARACAPWAEVMFERLETLLVWPKDRDDFPHGVPSRVDARVIERGVWRVTLQPQLPAGVDQATQDAMLKAELAFDATPLSQAVVNQVVQCGLFGEVLYR